MTFALMYSPLFLEHFSPYEHPECPERLKYILQGLTDAGVMDNAYKIPARSATLEELFAVHDENYVKNVLDILSNENSGNLDPDTFFSKGTHDAALHAAGGCVDLARIVHNRKANWGFAVPRPPGHHATPVKPCGFCIINNIAVAAASLLNSKMAEKIAIIDWDVHHGNGTQDIFYSDSRVLYISIHQWPHFPGSGRPGEMGPAGKEATTINIPFPAGAGDGDYMEALRRIALPLIYNFKPCHIMVSAGFDAHANDPLAGHNLTSSSYGIMTKAIKKAAYQLCSGRLTFVLEGGYNFNALRESVCLVAKTMEEKSAPMDDFLKEYYAGKLYKEVIDKTIDAYKPFLPGVLPD